MSLHDVISAAAANSEAPVIEPVPETVAAPVELQTETQPEPEAPAAVVPPAPAPQARDDREGWIPPARFNQVNSAMRQATTRYNQATAELATLKQTVDSLQAQLAQRQTPTQAAATAEESDEDLFDRLVNGDKPVAGLDKESKKIIDQLGKQVQGLLQQQQLQETAREELLQDADLDDGLHVLQKECPHLPEEMAIAEYAAGWTTAKIISEYNKMMPAAQRASAPQTVRAPTSSTPPQIARPGTPAAATPSKLEFKDLGSYIHRRLSAVG